MRILFAGSSKIACPSLAALVDLQLKTDLCEVAGILTNPDTAKGRHAHATPSALSEGATLLSERLHAAKKPPILQFKYAQLGKAETERLHTVCRYDILISFAYGKFFPPEFLARFPLGGINIHPSLLPKYRGPSPIQAAILNGDTETGITLQRLAGLIDTGAILAQESFPLKGDETGGTLAAFVAERAAGMVCRWVADRAGNRVCERAQNEAEASYCEKSNHASRKIDWARSARAVDAHIRAYAPDELCWTWHGKRVLSVLEGSALNGILGKTPGAVVGVDKDHGILIQCGDGIYAARVLQYQAKKALDFRSFLNGAKKFIGTQLG
ncbi:MAG: methionyl-tRNA formyltransferase [Spirochaetaceae bacterium]|nr:methionyl-tRNA formyltransferase [Spirochaetaceae bacterium]